MSVVFDGMIFIIEVNRLSRLSGFLVDHHQIIMRKRGVRSWIGFDGG